MWSTLFAKLINLNLKHNLAWPIYKIINSESSSLNNPERDVTIDESFMLKLDRLGYIFYYKRLVWNRIIFIVQI